MSSHRRRHRASRLGRRLLTVGVVAVVIAGLVVGSLQLFGTSWVSNAVTAMTSAVSPGCGERSSLVVVADPSIAPALTSIAETFDEEPGHCTLTEVRSQVSADTAALLASGAGEDMDAWVPDSPVWIDRMLTTAESLSAPAPDFEQGDPIASTPLVFAIPAGRFSDFTEKPPSWSGMLDGTVGTLVPDPEASGASLAGLAAIQALAPASDPAPFGAAILELGKKIPDTTRSAFDSANNAVRPTVVLTSEQEVASYNDEDPVTPLIALYPTDGTVALDYPFITLGGASSSTTADSSTSEAPQRADAQLVSDFSDAARAATGDLATSGFRDSKGKGEVRIAGVKRDAPPASQAADGAIQLEILRSWSVLTLRSKILVAVDVSGSMLDPTPSGLRPIDIFQKAAGESLGKFSGEAELGLWVFSQNRVGEQDWEPLVPIAPLGDPTHLGELNKGVASLPKLAYGATGLYDTVLAAVEGVRKEYDPSKINSVLLITDGRNEDDNGIDLPKLVSSLKAMDDPAKPVPVILIGMGPDTDTDAMGKIAEATGGGAYSALVPDDLSKVLVTALSQRGCRPNCPTT